MDEQDEIISKFLIESQENLDRLDQDLVALESEPGAHDRLGSIFRTIHCLQGYGWFSCPEHVLAGMGQNEFVDCQRLYAQGGSVFAQDEANSVVWGMPGVVARGGIADRVMPLPEIGPAIVSRVGMCPVARYAI